MNFHTKNKIKIAFVLALRFILIFGIGFLSLAIDTTTFAGKVFIWIAIIIGIIIFVKSLIWSADAFNEEVRN